MLELSLWCYWWALFCGNVYKCTLTSRLNLYLYNIHDPQSSLMLFSMLYTWFLLYPSSFLIWQLPYLLQMELGVLSNYLSLFMNMFFSFNSGLTIIDTWSLPSWIMVGQTWVFKVLLLWWWEQLNMRPHFKIPVVIIATALVAFSFGIYVHETSVSRGRPSNTPGSSVFTLGSIRSLFTTKLTLPEKVRTRGILNTTDGCRRLWLKGQSFWFDYKFNGSLSPLWTRYNKELTPVTAQWWKVSHLGILYINPLIWPDHLVTG